MPEVELDQPSGDEYREAASAHTDAAHLRHDNGRSAHRAIQDANYANQKAAKADRKKK